MGLDNISVRAKKTIEAALVFSREMPEGTPIPTDEDCLRFTAWHSRGESYNPLTPGLARLVSGFKNIGLCLGKVTSPDSWAYGFKHGLLFLSDFIVEEAPEIEMEMALACYRKTMGSVPACYGVGPRLTLPPWWGQSGAA